MVELCVDQWGFSKCCVSVHYGLSCLKNGKFCKILDSYLYSYVLRKTSFFHPFIHFVSSFIHSSFFHSFSIRSFINSFIFLSMFIHSFNHALC